MMGSKVIPKAQKIQGGPRIVAPHVTSVRLGITFSFELLEYTEYFNLDSTCESWSKELFNKMKGFSCMTENEIRSGQHGTIRFHNHEHGKIPSKLPVGVDPKTCEQIRLGKHKGGIHGVLTEGVFYVIWFDPLHNMYPDKRYGGLRIIQPPKTCCMDRDEKIDELQKIIDKQNEDITKLKEEIGAYEELFEESSIAYSSQ